MAGYTCQFCSQVVGSAKQYLSHYKHHKNVKNIVFPCCFRLCKRDFVKFSSLKCHITRDHVQPPKDNIQNRLHSNNFICSISSCKLEMENLKEFISHCKKHIGPCQAMSCPFLGCKGVFTKQSSYTSHISRKHKSCLTGFKDIFRKNSAVCSWSKSGETDSVENNLEIEENFESCNSNEDLSKVLIDSLALYYMKLEAIHLIPISTINSIMTDVADLHSLSIDMMLKNANFENSLKINQIRDHDGLSKLINGDQARFNTDFKRKSFFRQNFRYVAPVELYLGLDENNKRCIYHYVPLKSMLRALLEDQGVLEQIKKPLESKADVFSDVTDGESFLSNKYFVKNKDALRLMLYQDAFEIVNPLGSAKKTFKLIGFYFTLLDIYPFNRSKIDPLQLLILCRERDFLYFDNGRVVLERLINEIQELSTGVNVDGMFIKANVVNVLGDNLGSHFIGGFCTNFSSGEYYCRYCLMTKVSYEQNPMNIRNAELRTEENFDSSVIAITKNKINHQNGIKCNSLFNVLDGFHVCKPALPPCLGHDLFEGVIKFDLALLLNNLINVKKWVNLKNLNFCISSFNYVSNDLENKPVPIKAKCDNIGGHAVQIWTLLRLLPIMLSDYVKDPEDDVWRAILLLRLITEYLCAPKVSTNQIGIIQQNLDDYINMRKSLFPSVKLRPKHHYVHHYPYLITQFGPLMRVWTMRFESKHSYFKRCIRSSKNFKNVTKTLSEKHQLLQAYYSVGSLFQTKSFHVENVQTFSEDLVGSDMLRVINKFLNISTSITYTKSVTIYGYTIKSGNCIILNNDFESLGFGKILFFLIVNDSDLKVVCRHRSAIRSNHGLYELDFETGDIVVVNINEVLDLCPLNLYKNSIALKFYPLNMWN